MTSLDDFRRACQPKILIIDLHTDTVVRQVLFPKEVLRPASLLTNLVIDESVQGSCDSAVTYITDTAAPGQSTRIPVNFTRNFTRNSSPNSTPKKSEWNVASWLHFTCWVVAGIIIYDSAKDQAYRVMHPTMFPDPDFSDYSIDNERFTLMDGVVGLAHSPNLGILYYQPLATDR